MVKRILAAILSLLAQSLAFAGPATEERTASRDQIFESMPSLETPYQTIPEGDYYVRKILIRSVSYEGISPFDYASLCVRVRKSTGSDGKSVNRIWLYDGETMKKLDKKIELTRWNDCSWEECGSYFTERTYNEIPCSWPGTINWAELKDSGTGFHSDSFNEVFMRSIDPDEELTADFCVHYCLYYSKNTNRDSEGHPSDTEVEPGLCLSAASFKDGIQSEYKYIFGPQKCEPEVAYEIPFPVLVVPTAKIEAYTHRDFSKSPDILLSFPAPNDALHEIMEYGEPPALVLTGMVQGKNGIYYEARYRGSSVWIKESSVPEKSCYPAMYFISRRLEYLVH